MDVLWSRPGKNTRSRHPPHDPARLKRVTTGWNGDSVASIVTFGWRRFRNTKTYDLLTASPLIGWYWFGLHSQMPLLHQRAAELGAGSISLKDLLQFDALLGSAALNLIAIYFLAIRSLPLARSKGVVPRVTAIAGSFLGSGILFLPAAQ
jgi:hypothetical protein